MRVCGDCVNHRHDSANTQDRKMIELGYAPCQIRKEMGAYYHKNFIACEEYHVKAKEVQSMQRSI